LEQLTKGGEQTLTLKTDDRWPKEAVSGTITVTSVYFKGGETPRVELAPVVKPATLVASEKPKQDTPLAVKVADGDAALGATRDIVEYRNPQKMAQLPVQNLKDEADKNGDIFAMLALGIKFGNGVGIKQNEQDALIWYTRAADQGNSEGQFKAGLYHLMGYGCDQNEKEAFAFYLKAANQDHEGGCFSLAEMYESGWGVEANKEEAKNWYKKAANLGDPDAQMSLGRIYVAEKIMEMVTSITIWPACRIFMWPTMN
jgi:TPR repeat protein